MIAVAMVAVYAAPLVHIAEVGVWVVLPTAGPLLWLAWRSATAAPDDEPPKAGHWVRSFLRAFFVNLGLVYAVLMAACELIRRFGSD
jgi:hypothetical protein